MKSGNRFNPGTQFVLLSRLWLGIPCAIVLALMTNLFGGQAGAVRAAQAQQDALSENTINQIRSLMEAKAARTEGERKLGSNLIAAYKQSRGEAFAQGVPSLRSGAALARLGSLLVDIKAKVTDELLSNLEESGCEIINHFKQYDSIRARVQVSQLESLADLPGIEFIRKADEFELRNARSQEEPAGSQVFAGQNESFFARASRVRTQLDAAVASLHKRGNSDNPVFMPAVGAATSSGDIAHAANAARTTYHINGAGVKIGVISDSYNSLNQAATNVVTGDLPGPGNPFGFTTPVTVLQDASGTDEGRAMLQIVHDLAPGAQLYFATADFGLSNFAANVINLRNAGCDIIIDDVGYFAEAAFQDDVLAQAVNTVTASGALYFSSAGNSGNLNDNTSGVWEGDFNDSGVDITDGFDAWRMHSFGSANFNTVVSGGGNRRVDLFWSDPLGQSANDYDVLVLDSSGDIVDGSFNFQTGTQDPYEGDTEALVVGDKIVIGKFNGSARFLHLETGRGRLSIPTSGQTRGHQCAVNAFCVAAVNVVVAGGSAFIGGVTNPVESFSSDGPRRVFYNANGNAITPGNVSSTGGAVRQKPDITAADGVATTVSGFGTFFGTSAAAPHAGAIAALIKSANPSLTASQIRTALTSTALDIEAAGVDRDSGSGIVMALASLNSILSVHTLTVASLNPGSGVNITVSPNDNNGSGNGTTQFTRVYNHNAVVMLTAPATAGGNNFVKWQLDGVDYTTNQMASLPLDGDHTLTAIYSNGVCTVNPINLGTPVNGSLSATDCRSPIKGNTFFADRYSFSGTAGQQISVSLSSATYDTFLYLIGTGGTVIAQDNNGGGGTNSRIPATTGLFTLPSTGTYTIEVTSNVANALGTYSLRLGVFDTDNDSMPDEVEAVEGRNPDLKDNDIFTNARWFAMQQYRDYLGREGDSSGINFWTNQITSGSSTRAQVIDNFFKSAEFQVTTPITRLYFAYFLRVPDYTGLLFWVNEYRNGLSLDIISQNFAGSAEFIQTYGSLNNSDFVTLVYQNVLGRAPDPGGFAFWVNELNTGAQTRGQVMLNFSESTENKQTSANKVYVVQMYVGMLRRSPEQSGFNFWVNEMNQGSSGLNLIQEFLVSLEYHNRFLP